MGTEFGRKNLMREGGWGPTGGVWHGGILPTGAHPLFQMFLGREEVRGGEGSGDKGAPKNLSGAEIEHSRPPTQRKNQRKRDIRGCLSGFAKGGSVSLNDLKEKGEGGHGGEGGGDGEKARH